MFSENLTEILVVKMLLADLSHSYWINKNVQSCNLQKVPSAINFALESKEYTSIN